VFMSLNKIFGNVFNPILLDNMEQCDPNT
jgi:hypothetical protein